MGKVMLKADRSELCQCCLGHTCLKLQEQHALPLPMQAYRPRPLLCLQSLAYMEFVAWWPNHADCLGVAPDSKHT